MLGLKLIRVFKMNHYWNQIVFALWQKVHMVITNRHVCLMQKYVSMHIILYITSTRVITSSYLYESPAQNSMEMWTHLWLGKHNNPKERAELFKNKDLFVACRKQPSRSSLKSVPKGLIDNKWAFVQVMAWHSTGDKPLSEPMLIQFTDAYLRH